MGNRDASVKVIDSSSTPKTSPPSCSAAGTPFFSSARAMPAKPSMAMRPLRRSGKDPANAKTSRAVSVSCGHISTGGEPGLAAGTELSAAARTTKRLLPAAAAGRTTLLMLRLLHEAACAARVADLSAIATAIVDCRSLWCLQHELNYQGSVLFFNTTINQPMSATFTPAADVTHFSDHPDLPSSHGFQRVKQPQAVAKASIHQESSHSTAWIGPFFFQP